MMEDLPEKYELIPQSVEYVSEPDEDGFYDKEFLITTDELHNGNPEDEEDMIMAQIGRGHESGPGGSFTKRWVSYQGQKGEGKYVFKVAEQGGMDV